MTVDEVCADLMLEKETNITYVMVTYLVFGHHSGLSLPPLPDFHLWDIFSIKLRQQFACNQTPGKKSYF